MAKTWRELEAEGIKRCNAMFTNGHRCRRRAVAEFDFSWCAKHGPIIKRHEDFAKEALKTQRRIDDNDEGDE